MQRIEELQKVHTGVAISIAHYMRIRHVDLLLLLIVDGWEAIMIEVMYRDGWLGE